jgi:hypothetical protein
MYSIHCGWKLPAKTRPVNLLPLVGSRAGEIHSGKRLWFFLSAGPVVLLFASRGCVFNQVLLCGHRKARIVYIDEQGRIIERECGIARRPSQCGPIRYRAGPRVHNARPEVPQPVPPPRLRPPELKQKLQVPLLFVVPLNTQGSLNSIGPLIL